MRKFLLGLVSVCSIVGVGRAGAGLVYSDGFDTAADSSNYTITSSKTSTSTPASDATFGYDYSALGISSAPGTTGTTGLRVRVDNLGNTSGETVGDITAATKLTTAQKSELTQANDPAGYVVSAYVWGNYINNGTNVSSSGSNGTSGASLGIGTAGTSEQSPNTNDGFAAGMVHDNGALPTYRAYVHTTNEPGTSGFFAAGNASTSNNFSDPYYTAFLPGKTPPGAQTSVSSTQIGTSPAGLISFAWHQVTITQNWTNVTWTIDGHTIATVPDSTIGTFGGQNVSLGDFDTGTGGNTATANQTLNADIWDNLTITTLPEPSLAFLAVGVPLMAARRRQRS